MLSLCRIQTDWEASESSLFSIERSACHVKRNPFFATYNRKSTAKLQCSFNIPNESKAVEDHTNLYKIKGKLRNVKPFLFTLIITQMTRFVTRGNISVLMAFGVNISPYLTSRSVVNSSSLVLIYLNLIAVCNILNYLF